MIQEATYRAARTVAVTIENHFTHYLEDARKLSEQELAPKPDAKIIEAMIDITFWASLRREEGYPPKISLAFLPPERAGKPLTFGFRFPLTSNILTKLAPAVERPGIHLGVWHEQEELYIWGTTREIPGICFVLEVIEPGLLVIKHRRIDGFGKFFNVAILKGDQVKMVDERKARLPDSPAILTSMLSFISPSCRRNDSLNLLVQLALSIRAHKRGGSLLVVPAGTDAWQESIIQPVSYPVVPAFTTLSDLMQQDSNEMSQDMWQGALRLAVDSIAGLTAVDGATLINDKYELLGFGAKIERAAKSMPVEQMIFTEPVIGNEATIVHPASNGGTRHLSAAQFVFDQRNCLALIASQDGHFTIFAWSPREGMVHAHRVDSLLL